MIDKEREAKSKHITKKHLKTMTKNSRGHKLRNTGRVVKYGTISFGRNVWLSIAATLVMTITLIISLITVGASVILSSTADTMREKIDITVYFKPGTEQETLEELSSIMKEDKNVKSVEVADSTAEYERSLNENANNEDLLTILQDEDMKKIMLTQKMPASMRIKAYDVNDLNSIKQTVNSNPLFIENIDQNNAPTYDVNQTEIETITSWANIAKNGGLILGAVFLVISILVIFNTIRMAIFSRREEIYMMKLVGASRNFIRGPFIVEAQICGVIAGVISSTLAYVGYRFLEPKLSGYGINMSNLTNVLESQWLVLVFIATILVGMLIGTISAKLAIRKYLR